MEAAACPLRGGAGPIRWGRPHHRHHTPVAWETPGRRTPQSLSVGPDRLTGGRARSASRHFLTPRLRLPPARSGRRRAGPCRYPGWRWPGINQGPDTVGLVIPCRSGKDVSSSDPVPHAVFRRLRWAGLRRPAWTPRCVPPAEQASPAPGQPKRHGPGRSDYGGLIGEGAAAPRHAPLKEHVRPTAPLAQYRRLAVSQRLCSGRPPTRSRRSASRLSPRLGVHASRWPTRYSRVVRPSPATAP